MPSSRSIAWNVRPSLKMLIHAAFGKIIPTEVALLSTALLIGGSMLVPVIKTRRLPKAVATPEAFHGWVPESPAKTETGEDSAGE